MLLIDCGNTALKCEYDHQLSTFYLDDSQFKFKFKAYVKALKQDTAVVLSSVASAHTYQSIINTLNDHFKIPIKTAITEDQFKHLKIGYKQTKQLGVDRWLAMIATQHIKTNRIIIDAGSWIKMDTVLADGQHLGGVIISKSKHDEDDIFKRFSLNKLLCGDKTTLFGTSTQQCLCLSFKHYGLDAVNTLLSQWLTHLDQPCHIIISGGDAIDIKQSIQKLDKNTQKHILDIQQIENLVLLGLSTRYNR